MFYRFVLTNNISLFIFLVAGRLRGDLISDKRRNFLMKIVLLLTPASFSHSFFCSLLSILHPRYSVSLLGLIVKNKIAFLWRLLDHFNAFSTKAGCQFLFLSDRDVGAPKGRITN